MEKGIFSQSISLKGTGYTLAGLVGSEEEKEALKHCNDWQRLPFMTHVGYGSEDYSLIVHVDMVYCKAALYVYRGYSRTPEFNSLILRTGGDEQILTPEKEWDNLPEKVWVAVSMKRNSTGEAVLLPCIHWAVGEIGGAP